MGKYKRNQTGIMRTRRNLKDAGRDKEREKRRDRQ